MSLATFITNAVVKVSTDETYATMEFASREEARANFVAALLFELGLGPAPVAVHAPVAEPKEEKKKETKKRAPKKAAAVDALAEQMGQLAIAEAKSEDELKKEEPPAKKARKTKPKVEEEAPKVEEASEPAQASKKPRAPKKTKAEEVPAEAPAANAGAAAEAAPKKKPGPKPKAKPATEGPVNIDKLTPTHKKHIKKMSEELQCGIDDKGFLAYANAMSAEAWGAKSLDDHIRDFAGPQTVPLAPAPVEFQVVEFNGVDYLVDPETKFVYENVAEGAPVRNRLGTVGLLEFKDMEV